MKTTIENCIGKDGCKTEQVSSVNFVFKNSGMLWFPCSLTPEDFVKVWNKSIFTVKIPGPNGSYAFIHKRSVEGFTVEPYAEQSVPRAVGFSSGSSSANILLSSDGEQR